MNIVFHSSLANNTKDTCENVSYPNSVTYQVSVSVTPEYCDGYDSRDTAAQLLYIGFGDMTINISVLCSCDCESDRVSWHSIYIYSTGSNDVL